MFRIFRPRDLATTPRLALVAGIAAGLAAWLAAGAAGASTTPGEETTAAVKVASAPENVAIPLHEKSTIEIVPPVGAGALGFVIYRFEKSQFAPGLSFGGPP